MEIEELRAKAITQLNEFLESKNESLRLQAACFVINMTGNKTKAGKPWSPEEDKMLKDAFENGTPMQEIVKAHGRSSGGVIARLKKIGLVQ